MSKKGRRCKEKSQGLKLGMLREEKEKAGVEWEGILILREEGRGWESMVVFFFQFLKEGMKETQAGGGEGTGEEGERCFFCSLFLIFPYLRRKRNSPAKRERGGGGEVGPGEKSGGDERECVWGREMG
eukprot:Sspe_Gene.42074::Locus_20411_Transcript_1_1_Confidence_1.000_Length_823::g.42074::m.42074